jgi:[ribosomal protein S5]-alanine N-acetyltransferase
MQNRFEVSTPRLILVGADEASLRAELSSREALAVAIDAIVTAAWPPEHHDRNVIEWVLGSLSTLAPEDPWRFFYMVLNSPRTLIGTCGFKGAPDGNACVEVGYSVLEQFRRRGFASEAVLALMSLAFARGASEVAAETFPSLAPSLRVMQKCGMSSVGEGSEPGTVRYSKRL